MTPPDDMPALLAWVGEQELDAHNNVETCRRFGSGVKDTCPNDDGYCRYDCCEESGKEKAYKAVADKIGNISGEGKDQGAD